MGTSTLMIEQALRNQSRFAIKVLRRLWFKMLLIGAHALDYVVCTENLHKWKRLIDNRNLKFNMMVQNARGL